MEKGSKLLRDSIKIQWELVKLNKWVQTSQMYSNGDKCKVLDFD